MDKRDNGYGFPHWAKVVLIGRSPRFTAARMAVLAAVTFAISTFILVPIRVQGPSMMPTYQSNGINFVNRLAYWHAQPQRGDVIAIRYSGRHAMLMKRVVGLPGETVRFHQGFIYIDDRKLDEPYLNPNVYQCDWELPPETLAADEYYVVGDNRSMPYEYHTFGKAKRERIMGRILLCKNLFAL